MTEHRSLLTRLVADGLSNQQIADSMSAEIGDVISVPQIARFKREFGLVKSGDKPPELVVERIPRTNHALQRMLNMLFARQIETLAENGVEVKVSADLFEVDGKTLDLESLNALYQKKVNELKEMNEKQQAIAQLKAMGVGKEELLKLFKSVE